MGNGPGWPIGSRTTAAGSDVTQRAERRAEERAQRAKERAEAADLRAQARATRRDDAARERESARETRSLQEPRMPIRTRDAGGGDTAAPSRPRRSGRKDVVREQRDTRAYRTVINVDRMRALAARGASVTGLAGAFGVSVEEIEQFLSAAAAEV